MDNKIEERLKKIEERLDALEKMYSQVQSPTSNKTTKKISIKEFLIEKAPKTALEIAFYIGYFLEKNEMKTSFSIEDLRTGYKLAKISLPKNLNDVVNKNISKGYFMDYEKNEKGQKSWVLTATGEKHAEGEKNNE